MAYLMQNGVNLGPVIEVTSLPYGSAMNKHAVYRLIHYDDPFHIPPEYAATYGGMDPGFYGSGIKIAQHPLPGGGTEDYWYQPEISASGLVFPDRSLNLEGQNVFGERTWDNFVNDVNTLSFIHGIFSSGDLDDDDNEVVTEFSIYWDGEVNHTVCQYGTDTPRGSKICDGFYIWDGLNSYTRIDGDTPEMIGASYSADGSGGTVPAPVKQNGFAALLSDGTFGFPEATISTFYGTGGQCSWDIDPDYWGLIGKKYNDKATGGFVSYDCPTHPMLIVSAYPKECLLHVDMQWNGNNFFVIEKATPINQTNGIVSPITYIRSGYFTKLPTVDLATTHFSGSGTTWNPWYTVSDDTTFKNRITNANAVETIGGYKNASVALYETLHFTYTVPITQTISTTSGNVSISKGMLTTEVVADAFLLGSSNCLLSVNQTIEKLDLTNYKTTATYTRHGYFNISSTSFTIGDWWASITWDAQWTPDPTAKVSSLTKTQYNAIATKDPNTIYVVDMQA